MRDQEYKALPDGRLRREKKYYKKEKIIRTFIERNSSQLMQYKDAFMNKQRAFVERHRGNMNKLCVKE